MDNPDPDSPILASFKLLLFSQCSFTNVYIGLASRVYRIGVYLYTCQALSIMCVRVCVCVHEGAASGVEEKGVGGGLRWCWPRLSLEKGLAEEKLATTENGK